MENIVRNKNRIIKVVFIFFFFSFFITNLVVLAQDRKMDLLRNTKQFVKEEIQDSLRSAELIADIDFLLTRKEPDEEEMISLISSITEQFRLEGKLAAAIELFMNVVSLYEQLEQGGDEREKVLLHFYIPLGAAHEEMGMWNRAMDFYLKALTLAEKAGMDHYIAMIYNNIGAIHYNRTEINMAENYFLKALEINKKINRRKELFNNYNNLAGIYSRKNDYDQALDYALLAIQQVDSKDDPYNYYFMQMNIASIYLYKKEYTLAMSYLRNAMKYQKLYNYSVDLVQTYLLMMEAYNGLGLKDSAQFYIHKSFTQSSLVDNKYIETRVLKRAADYYQINADYKSAYELLMKAAILEDSLTHINNLQKINDLELIYDAEKKIRENEMTIKDITLRKLAADRLWIIMAFVALLLGLIILYLINLSKNREKMRKANELLALQQKELYEKEKNIQFQKEQELSYIIDKKNRELTSYTLSLVKTNEFLSDLNEELKQLLLELNPKDKMHREHVKQILAKLHHQSHADNWEDFRYYFEQVHPSFYENLERHCPDLTLKEKRLCAFLRLGLSSKEISAITFKEVRSVESARNRLRKKLNINPDGNLTEFLTELSYGNTPE